MPPRVFHSNFSPRALWHLERVWRLYTRNIALSAAFYGPLQGPEIAVCKALHRELTARFGHEWYDNRLTIRPNSCGNVNGLFQSA